MGFGLHDPGRNRDSTVLRQDHFDAQYPIRLDWPCEGLNAGHYAVTTLLARLKRELPYNLRYQNDAGARLDYENVNVNVPEDDMAASDVLALIAEALPQYQITALPGYVIMYRESRTYPQGEVIGP